MISNIWKHPKTSLIGILSAVATGAAALATAGVGPAKYLGLAGSIATLLLGAFAKDPGTPAANTTGASSATSSTAKLGAWALISVLLMGTMTACSAQKVAQEIVNWTPALQSAVASVDAMGAVLAPQDAAIFAAATAGFDVGSNLLVAQAKAYLASPTATIFAQLQTQIVTFQQQVNAALLQAVKITDPASRAKVQADINAVATIVNAMLALVVSISSKAQVAAMADAATIKLAQIEPLVNREIVLATLDKQYPDAGRDGNADTLTLYTVGVAQLEQSGF